MPESSIEAALRRWPVAGIACVMVWGGCGGAPVSAPVSSPVSSTVGGPVEAGARPSEPPVLDAAFVEQVRLVAGRYQEWGRVDEHPALAPTACAPPPANLPRAQLRRSAAEDGPHGKKVYYLWASLREPYLNHAHEDVSVGFAIVKQSFSTKVVAPRAGERATEVVHLPSGEQLVADQASDLFVMTKVAANAAAGTDAGWIYGTVAMDGTVTSAGRVASCMHCHEQAARDRLFGLPPR